MLRAWLDYWPAQQMVALNYEDLVARPEELVNGILQKLGALSALPVQGAALLAVQRESALLLPA